MKNQPYIVKKGDTLWDLSRRFLGAPTRWPHIHSYNNRPEVVRVTGTAIKNPDIIFPGQKLLLPILPQQPKVPKKVKPREHPPAKLKDRIHKTYMPFASMYKLDDLPLLEYESFTTPGFKASISFQGDVAIRLADKVPLSHVTNRGLEIHYKSMTDAVLGQLLQDSVVEWDKTTNKIRYACNMVSHSDTPHALSTSIGVALASDTPVPVLRAEIRYPELKGYFQRNFFMAMNVRVVIDLEPRTLVVKGPETMQFDQRQVFDNRQVPITNPTSESQNNFNGWDLLMVGTIALVATIATDFLWGVGLADDAVTIPAALAAIRSGVTRVIFPVVAAGAATACSSSNSKAVKGMPCKAAHTQ